MPCGVFANFPSGSPALRACHARAISPGSRARADRPHSPRTRDRPHINHFAGMGCSPPHIALLSGLQGTGMTGRQITEALSRLAMQFGPVQGRLLPRCKCVPAVPDEFRPARSRRKLRRCWFFFSRASLMFFTRRDSDRRFFHPRREARSASSARFLSTLSDPQPFDSESSSTNHLSNPNPHERTPE